MTTPPYPTPGGLEFLHIAASSPFSEGGIAHPGRGRRPLAPSGSFQNWWPCCHAPDDVSWSPWEHGLGELRSISEASPSLNWHRNGPHAPPVASRRSAEPETKALRWRPWEVRKSPSSFIGNNWFYWKYGGGSSSKCTLSRCVRWRGGPDDARG